jgi:hypothetical protein
MNPAVIELAAVPDLMKRFVEVPYSTTIVIASSVYQFKTNCSRVFAYASNLSGDKDLVSPRVAWECTVLRDTDYPLDQSDDLYFESEGLHLHLQPGRLIVVDHDHHRIVTFLSGEAPIDPSSLIQQLVWLSQLSATECCVPKGHPDESL